MVNTVIGIDVGTQSSKVLFYDFENHRIVATGSAPHKIITGADGKSEQEASWWVEAIVTAMAEVPEEVRRSAVAVGVSGQQHGFVPVSAEGEVLHPVKLWNDTSTAAECREITEALGGTAELIRNEGNPVLPGYTASKILWLKKNHPEKFRRLGSIMMPHDYINYVLTGEASMEYGDASGTGLLDIRNRCWSQRAADAIDQDLIKKLPPLRSPQEGAGRVTEEAAALFGIPEGIPVSTGGGDNMMAALGTGAVVPGRLTISLGTSGTLFGYSETPVADPEGIIAGFCSSSGGWLPLLCTMNCTTATEELRSLFDMDLAALEAAASGAPAGCAGVTVLPYFSGERTPNLPGARASIQGLNRENSSRNNILRAAMEAAVYGMMIGLEAMNRLGVRASELVLTGGGSKNRLWQQMTADITGLPVKLLASHDSAALGAAVQALWFFQKGHPGGGKTLEDLVEDHVVKSGGQTITPGENREGYREGYRRYQEYLGRLEDLYR